MTIIIINNNPFFWLRLYIISLLRLQIKCARIVFFKPQLLLFFCFTFSQENGLCQCIVIDSVENVTIVCLW